METVKRLTKNVAARICAGEIAIIPTDTMYGVSCRADNIACVERVYKLRRRNPLKPYIVLISDMDDLKKLKVSVSQETARMLKKLWPNPITVVLPYKRKKMKYLHRGTDTIALRMPKGKEIRNFLKISGPLISTSANWEGHPPAQTIKEAQKYFGEEADIYVDKGKLPGIPSTIVALKGKKVEIIREGVISKDRLLRIIGKKESK